MNRRVIALAVLIAASTACETSSAASALSDEQHAAVIDAFKRDVRTPPETLELVGSMVVADFLLTDENRREMNGTIREYAERRLIMIREALLPFGYTHYRVNVNGPPPGTGLIKRYGSARLMGSGSVEWLTGK